MHSVAVLLAYFGFIITRVKLYWRKDKRRTATPAQPHYKPLKPGDLPMSITSDVLNDLTDLSGRYLTEAGQAVGSEVDTALRAFLAWLHPTAALQDAIALLTTNGYTVTPPAAPTPAPAA